MTHPPNETKRTFWRRDVSRIVSTAAADFFFAPLALLLADALSIARRRCSAAARAALPGATAKRRSISCAS